MEATSNILIFLISLICFLQFVFPARLVAYFPHTLQRLIRYVRQVLDALHVGRVVNTLGRLYKLDQPEPLEKAGMNLKAVGLEELKPVILNFRQTPPVVWPLASSTSASRRCRMICSAGYRFFGIPPPFHVQSVP